MALSDDIQKINSTFEERQEELKLDFKKNMALISKAIDFLTNIFDINFVSMVSENKATTVMNRIGELSTALSKIVTYNPRSSNDVKNEPTNLSNHLVNVYDQAVDAWSTVAFLHENDAMTDMNILQAEAALAKDRILDVEKQMNEVLQASKGSIVQRGVETSALDFSTQAEKYKTQSYLWLGITFAISILSVITVLLLMSFFPLEGTDTKSAVNYLGSKLFIISILYILFALSIKNYSAAKHNATINTHRHNALSVYEKLVAGAPDIETKGAVLRQATEAIFSMQKTGYISKEPDGGNINKITEVINTAANRGQ